MMGLRYNSIKYSALLAFACLIGNLSFAEPAITTGTTNSALAYYANLSQTLLGLNAQPGVTTLDDLLAFAGYPTTGDKLEALDSAILMTPVLASATNGLGIALHGLNSANLRGGDILAARFFAPKIVNVNTTTPTPGWRKLIRLKARPDSPAARAGVESVIVLFNFLVPASGQPFSGQHSFNTQVMLLAPSLPDRLYWMDFDQDKKLALALNASFDAADLQSAGNHDYFVPDGCNACHGSPGNFAHPMVNYLDTDHWIDRLDDDFKNLKAAGTPVIFDAQTNDSSQPGFARAFDVIRLFNEETLLQNTLAQPSSFEAQAARTWLKLHAQSDQHFPPVARGFSSDGGPIWQASEADGLAQLDRFCFRCHGSVYFSVFDRPAVLKKAGNMQQRIKPGQQQLNRPGFKMPPDRVLDPQQVQTLYDFLGKLK